PLECVRYAALLVLILTIVTGDLLGATVTGSIRLADSRDPNVRRRGDFSGVVVWLERVGSAVQTRPKTASIVQKGKRFTPHIVAIPVGSWVDFPNADLIFHNAFSNFAGQPFDVGLYP